MIDNLTEAINHAREVAKENRNKARLFANNPFYGTISTKCEECAAEHEQLAGWLAELQERREADRWIPVSERLPEEKINPNTNDFAEVLCSTVWGDVRTYKFGKPIGFDESHFWHACGIMDKYVTHWRYLPEPYKEREGE